MCITGEKRPFVMTDKVGISIDEAVTVDF